MILKLVVVNQIKDKNNKIRKKKYTGTKNIIFIVLVNTLFKIVLIVYIKLNFFNFLNIPTNYQVLYCVLTIINFDKDL